MDIAFLAVEIVPLDERPQEEVVIGGLLGRLGITAGVRSDGWKEAAALGGSEGGVKRERLGKVGRRVRRPASLLLLFLDPILIPLLLLLLLLLLWVLTIEQLLCLFLDRFHGSSSSSSSIVHDVSEQLFTERNNIISTSFVLFGISLAKGHAAELQRQIKGTMSPRRWILKRNRRVGRRTQEEVG